MKRILLILTVALPLWAADVAHAPKPTKTTLVFDDGKEFDEADINVLKISQTLKNILDDLGSGTEEQIPITNISFKLFIQALYPLMQIIGTHSDDSVMKKRINDVLQALDLDQTKYLLVAANFLDIPPLLPLVVERFASLLTTPASLEQSLEQRTLIQLLDLPKELLNMVAQQLQKTVEMRKLLFKVIDPEPKITIPIYPRCMALALSSDGKTLASGLSNGAITLLDTTTGTLLHSLTGHITQIHSVAFSPDGKTLASGAGGDETIKVWDVATGQLLHSLTGHTLWVHSVAFSPDGKTLASGSADETVILWDTATGRLLHTLTDHTQSIYSVAFSPDGKTLAGGAADETVILWDTATGRLLHTLTGHTKPIYSVAFSPEGKTLASGSNDGTIKVWDVVTGRLLHTYSHTKRFFYSAAFSPDGKTLAGGSGDGTINLWDVATGTLLHTLSGHPGMVFPVAFSPNGQTLASGSVDGIQVWPVAFDRLPLEILLLIVLVSKNPGSINQENVRKNITLSLETVKDEAIKAKLRVYFDNFRAKTNRNAWLQKLLDAYNKTMKQFEGYQ